MTNDLISREALLKKSIRVSEFDEGGWEVVLRAVPVEEIEAAEAVDAAPVVRCKDCKHYHDGICEQIEYIMDGYYRDTFEVKRPDDFCSYGAKMDEEDV